MTTVEESEVEPLAVPTLSKPHCWIVLHILIALQPVCLDMPQY